MVYNSKLPPTYVESHHRYAPLTDHKLITIKFGGKEQRNSLWGYWKFNNSLLNDPIFCESIKSLALEIFNNRDVKDTLQWEYFKFKTMGNAVKRSKEIKELKTLKETKVMDKLSILLAKNSLNEEEKNQINQLQLEIDNIYIEIAKGALVRAKSRLLEHGEKNSSYFFALEKRNRKRNNITCLNINNESTCNSKTISEYAYAFYNDIYKSKNKETECDSFMNSVYSNIPTISDRYKQNCENAVTKREMAEAVKSMQKNKSPGCDGLTVEFYLHFWDTIEEPLFRLYNICIMQEELSVSMKRGLICPIPKPGKDVLFIENWGPITLLNTDDKMLAQIFTKRLKTNCRIGWSFEASTGS